MGEGVTTLPMFPLGAVLFPHMPLQLRVFEQRYLIMMARVLDADAAVFGVVLIERGQEVGGGEHRFGIGTVARITQLAAPEGFVGIVAQGEQRFEVLGWLEDDPHPQASVRLLEELEWDDELFPLREEAERVVRRALSLASEFDEQRWAPDVELSADPAIAAWQLAAIAPVGPLDQVSLLRATSMEALLRRVIEVTEVAADSFGL